MSKFKVGELVTPKKPTPTTNTGGIPTLILAMLSGDPLTVTKVDGAGWCSVKEMPFKFPPQTLKRFMPWWKKIVLGERIKAETQGTPEPLFKVGDKIVPKPYNPASYTGGISRKQIERMAGKPMTVKAVAPDKVWGQHWYHVEEEPFVLRQNIVTGLTE